MQASLIRVFAVCLFLVPITLLSGCKQNQDEQSQMVIIEEGQEENTANDLETDNDPFPDYGKEATVVDLLTARSKIKSYYYEQTINYSSGSVNIRTWYIDDKAKIISSAGGSAEEISYYDCADHTVVSYSPENGYNAIEMLFDDQELDLLIDQEDYDLSAWEVIGYESISDQSCLALKNSAGDKFWISTKYGIPLQVEFTDSMTGERLKVKYENYKINSLDLSEVEIPDELQI